MTAPQQREPPRQPQQHHQEQQPGESAGGCPGLSAELLAGYALGSLNPVAAWSVEAHLPCCAICRQGLASHADSGRLLRSKSLVLTSLALPAPGLAGRALIRCGVPEHVVRLLAVTPSLRRSWLTGVMLVLAVTVGSARLITPGYGLGAGARGLAAVSLSSGRLGPFLLLMPLLPLAGVAASFSSRLDPARALAAAAPISGAWLLCVRTIAVVTAAVVPASLAAVALPGPGWLPAALLLPALAVCGVAVAAATVFPPFAAALGAGLGWAAITGLAMIARAPAAAFGQAGQLTAAVILLAAICCLVIRRDRLDYGWVR